MLKDILKGLEVTAGNVAADIEKTKLRKSLDDEEENIRKKKKRQAAEMMAATMPNTKVTKEEAQAIQDWMPRKVRIRGYHTP